MSNTKTPLQEAMDHLEQENPRVSQYGKDMYRMGVLKGLEIAQRRHNPPLNKNIADASSYPEHEEESA